MAAVRLALAQGLSVVVNPHINGATHHWNHGRLLMSADTPGFALYRALVVELAARLQRLDTSRLALEPVNEPTHTCGAREWDVMQESLLSAARSTAPALTLVATGACGSMIAGLEPLKTAPLKRFAPLLYTFHFYEPYLFSHQGAPWMTEPVYRSLNNVPWPASAGSLQATLASVRARMAADRGRSRPRSGRPTQRRSASSRSISTRTPIAGSSTSTSRWCAAGRSARACPRSTS